MRLTKLASSTLGPVMARAGKRHAMPDIRPESQSRLLSRSNLSTSRGWIRPSMLGLSTVWTVFIISHFTRKHPNCGCFCTFLILHISAPIRFIISMYLLERRFRRHSSTHSPARHYRWRRSRCFRSSGKQECRSRPPSPSRNRATWSLGRGCVKGYAQ